MSEISAAILVGGRARRLDGQLKPALHVGGQTILERQLEALRDAGIHDILLVGRWPAPPVPGVRHVPDVLEEGSALAGLYSALLQATTTVVLVLAGDLPFVQPSLLRRVAGLAPNEDAAVPRTAEGWHPLCAAYRRGVAPKVKVRLDRGDLRLIDALDDMRVREVKVNDLASTDSADMILMNVNTPDDHKRAERRARRRA